LQDRAGQHGDFIRLLGNQAVGHLDLLLIRIDIQQLAHFDTRFGNIFRDILAVEKQDRSLLLFGFALVFVSMAINAIPTWYFISSSR
jgi:hypothetical protein